VKERGWGRVYQWKRSFFKKLRFLRTGFRVGRGSEKAKVPGFSPIPTTFLVIPITGLIKIITGIIIPTTFLVI